MIQVSARRSYLREGFTFIELVIAVAIMALLMGVGFFGYMQFFGKARTTATQTKLKSLKTAITQFNIDTGRYPRTLKDLAVKPTDDPSLVSKWKGPYVEEGEAYDEDGWGNRVVYKVTPGGKHKYELYSYGENGDGAPKEEWISVWGVERKE